jgi:hypothetical protein
MPMRVASLDGTQDDILSEGGMLLLIDTVQK